MAGGLVKWVIFIFPGKWGKVWENKYRQKPGGRKNTKFFIFLFHTLSLLFFFLLCFCFTFAGAATFEEEMRKHGWQLPYHPLQVLFLFIFLLLFLFLCKISKLFYYSNFGYWAKFSSFLLVFVKVVAVAVFLALGFAFYVFFAPFVGKKRIQYIVMGIYTPLVSYFNIFLLSLLYIF